MASSAKARSPTLRAIGPSTDKVAKGLSLGPAAILPGLGLIPTTEQKLAGILRLPPRSLPVPSQI